MLWKKRAVRYRNRRRPRFTYRFKNYYPRSISIGILSYRIFDIFLFFFFSFFFFCNTWIPRRVLFDMPLQINGRRLGQ